MHIAILQHVPHEGPAALADWAAARGHSARIRHLYTDPALPTADGFDALVVLGGGMSVHDGTRYPWLEQERALIRTALAEGKPVLGICLGAQQLAFALGAEVRPNPDREVGFWPLTRVDPALPLPEAFTACHWHGETFDLPDGAILLAASAACRHQIVLMEQGRALAMQCHLEATPEWVDGCCTHDAAYLIPGRWMQDAGRLRAETRAYPEMHRALFALLDAFFERSL